MRPADQVFAHADDADQVSNERFIVEKFQTHDSERMFVNFCSDGSGKHFLTSLCIAKTAVPRPHPFQY